MKLIKIRKNGSDHSQSANPPPTRPTGSTPPTFGASLTRLLFEAVDESLTAIGAQNKFLVISELENSGLKYNEMDLDIIRFNNLIKTVFPHFSELLMMRAYSNLCSKLSVTRQKNSQATGVQLIRGLIQNINQPSARQTSTYTQIM